jgi:nicotinamide riboside kinase
MVGAGEIGQRHGRVIALVGAESTGKSTLAAALARRLAEATGLACTAVDEVLREWCELQGRTPRLEEQAGIAAEQQRRIEAAAAAHDVVVADTTPLLIAVYSRIVFDDRSLDEPAGRWHAEHVALTLVTALDLPWTADGHQRDGEHVREPVDAALRELLAAHRITWSRVAGFGPARVESALDAVAPLLRSASNPKPGLFTRLAEREAGEPDWPWVCETCDVPECEHLLMRRRARTAPR